MYMGQLYPDTRDRLLSHLRSHHPGICRRWFDELGFDSIEDGVLTLVVHEPVRLKYLRRCCIKHFTDAAQVVTGHLLAVRFSDRFEEDGGALVSTNIDGAVDPDDDMLISPDYSFEQFIVGPGNRLAHAGAIAVGSKPGRAYNPFFVHSSVGLGKTHLLQAICQSGMRCNPDLRIFYTSCDGFMTRFLDAVQEGGMSEFRHRFRGYDMLLVDDIHDLSKRDRTQEEFFHTFNSLYQAGKQIVLSSDAPPWEIPDLEERLISRFNSGLVARIDRPCFETRVAILKMKASIRSIGLPDDVAEYIAARIDSNIRELEGVLTRLQSMAIVMESTINMTLAKEAIGDLGSPGRNNTPTIQRILDAVSGFYDVRLSELLSKRRHKSISLPRQVGMWLARRHTRFSLEEIGGYFGGRDHTTVMHAVRSIDLKRSDTPSLEQDISFIEGRLVDSQGRR